MNFNDAIKIQGTVQEAEVIESQAASDERVYTCLCGYQIPADGIRITGNILSFDTETRPTKCPKCGSTVIFKGGGEPVSS